MYQFSGACKEKCHYYGRRHEKDTDGSQSQKRRETNAGESSMNVIVVPFAC